MDLHTQLCTKLLQNILVASSGNHDCGNDGGRDNCGSDGGSSEYWSYIVHYNDSSHGEDCSGGFNCGDGRQ